MALYINSGKDINISGQVYRTMNKQEFKFSSSANMSLINEIEEFMKRILRLLI